MLGKWLRKNSISLAIMGVGAIAITGMGEFIAHADTASIATWDNAISAKVAVSDESGAWKDWYQPFCNQATAMVEDYSSLQEREVCYVGTANTQLAVYRTDPNSTTYYGLKKQGDTAFHRIASLFPMPSNLILLPNGTILGAKQGVDTDALTLYSLDSFSEHTQAVHISNGPTTYYTIYDVSLGDLVKYQDRYGHAFAVRRIAVSKNHKYAVSQTARGVSSLQAQYKDNALLLAGTTNQEQSSTLMPDTPLPDFSTSNIYADKQKAVDTSSRIAWIKYLVLLVFIAIIGGIIYANKKRNP